MSVAQIGIQIKGLKFPGFVSTVTPFRLGRLAAKKGMTPQSCWPLDMVVGWDNAGGVVRFSEEALAATGWRSDFDVDVFEPSI